MIIVRTPYLLLEDARLVCSHCREAVEWRGRWRHLWGPFNTHAIRVVVSP